MKHSHQYRRKGFEEEVSKYHFTLNLHQIYAN